MEPRSSAISNPNLALSQNSNRDATGMGTEGEDEISRLINESYQLDSDNNNLSAVFKNDKLYD